MDGDYALRSIAEAINTHVRPTDVSARQGGGEFVVLLPQTSTDQATGIAARLCEGVRTMGVYDAEGRALPSVTVSTGVASWQLGMAPGGLLAAADNALYRAKQVGRNQVCLQAL